MDKLDLYKYIKVFHQCQTNVAKVGQVNQNPLACHCHVASLDWTKQLGATTDLNLIQ